jgi:multidrug resistance efflux pump
LSTAGSVFGGAERDLRDRQLQGDTADTYEVGQPVSINVDTFPNHALHGHIDSFQRGTGSNFALLPPENATGNFVKVVQRAP